MKQIFISIIIPAYKEAGRISTTLFSLEEYFKNKIYSYEIIIVNDGSPDNLVAVVKEHMLLCKHIRLVNNKKNYGKGYAVKCGMFEARGEYALFMDADNSVSISNLNRFMSEMSKGADVVIGSIEIGHERKDERNGLHRRILSKLSKAPVRFFATPGIYDTQRGFKLFSRKAIDIIFPKQTVDRFAFDIELLVIALTNGLKLKELPVIFSNPTGSTVRLSAYTESLKDLFKIILRKIMGIYHIPSLAPLRVRTKKQQIRYPKLALLFICILFSSVIFFSFQTNKTVNATVDSTASETMIPRFLSQFTPQPVHDSPSWIYERQPVTKNTTGFLLFISILFLLYGGDLISGFCIPRLYFSFRRSLLTTTPLPTLSNLMSPL